MDIADHDISPEDSRPTAKLASRTHADDRDRGGKMVGEAQRETPLVVLVDTKRSSLDEILYRKRIGDLPAPGNFRRTGFISLETRGRKIIALGADQCRKEEYRRQYAARDDRERTAPERSYAEEVL